MSEFEGLSRISEHIQVVPLNRFESTLQLEWRPQKRTSSPTRRFLGLESKFLRQYRTAKDCWSGWPCSGSSQYHCPTCSTPFGRVEELCTHLTDDLRCNVVPIPHALRQPAGPDEDRMGRYHKKSGSIYGFNWPNMFERMKAHDYETAREHNVYYPFLGGRNGNWPSFSLRIWIRGK